MRISNLSNSRTARALALGALSAILIFMTGARQPVAAVVDTPTSVTFTLLRTACGESPNYSLKIGATTVGNIAGVNDCSCNAGLQTFTTTDATALAAVGTPAC